MKFNTVAFGAVGAAVVGEASATSAGACPASISGVSAFDPLGKLVACTRAANPTTETAYKALATNCLAPLVSAAGASFPANSGTTEVCYNCYLDFAKAMVNEGVGTWVSTVVEPPAQASLNASCGTITAADKREDCFKDHRVIHALNDFQTCSGFSLVYPATDDLAHRRVMYRLNAFEELVRSAFNSNVVLAEHVEHILNGDAEDPATGENLEAEVCYASLHDYLYDWSVTGDLSVINNCGSTVPTDHGCFNTTILTDAKDRFAACSGFNIDEFYPACGAAELTDLAGTYDAYGTIVSSVITSFNATEVRWTAVTEAIEGHVADVTGADCAVCFLELAEDIKASIVAKLALTPLANNQPLINQYLGNCADPTADACLVVIGAAALTNFKECSGVDLDRSAFVASTEAPTTEAPVETTEAPTTEEATTEEATTAEATTTKSAGFIAPLAGIVLLAISSALVL